MILHALLFIAGLVVLVVGAEALVRGASRLARSLSVPPVVIGLTIVAFGTSAPELVVSLTAAFKGGADIAIGNIVGSNIFNTGVILGLSALAIPLVVERRIKRIDCPMMLGATIALLAFGWDGVITRIEAAALLVALGVSLWLTFRKDDATPEPAAGPEPAAEAAPAPSNSALDLALVVLGLGALLGGGHLVVTAAVAIARNLGVSELVIGLTIVAAGTSLPELATSVLAALRGQPEIAVGNVVGSNILNILLILGVTGAVTPLPVSKQLFAFDMPVLLAFTLSAWPILAFGQNVGRKRGGLLLVGYLATLGVWLTAARP